MYFCTSYIMSLLRKVQNKLLFPLFYPLRDLKCANLLSIGLHALKRALGGSSQPSDQQLKGTVTVTLQDLQWAMSVVKPSAMREVAVDVPKVQ